MVMRHRLVTRGGGGKRTGVPRPNGRAIVDDMGGFNPLGLTFMWSNQGIKYEWDHYKANVEWAAAKGFDFKRPLEEVDWAGNRNIDPTKPEWRDWHDIVRKDLDFSYECGLRNGITIRGKGTSVDHMWLAREVGRIIADGRTHNVLICEMENEYSNGGDPLHELIAMAQQLSKIIPNMLALSTPGSEAEAERIKSESLRIAIKVMIRHTDRSGSDHGWRDVRQPYDFHNDGPLIGADWEGPGPGCSGSTNSNPLQLAMKRAVAAMCGAPIFVLHTGTGVYGDGKPGPQGQFRPPNFWEIPGIDAICEAVRGIDPLLPEGLPNWQVANTQWRPPLPVAPFQPHHHWEGDNQFDNKGNVNDGVNKAYAALAPDGRVIQMPCGVRGHALMTASYPLRDVTVFDPIALTPVPGFENRSFSTGESMDLPGGGLDAMVAYVIHGRR